MKLSLMIPAALVIAGAALPAAAKDNLELAREHVEYLASEQLEGRLTGSEGEALAADYLERQLVAMGATPIPGLDGFRHAFEFTAGMNDGGTVLTIETADGARSWTGDPAQVLALSFSDNATVTGPAVFAGYGIKTPDISTYPYDSFHGLELEGKVVVMLRYFPEGAEGDDRSELSQYSPLRYKVMTAREKGAAGVLFVTGPNSPNAGETIPMSFDTSLSGSGIAAASAGSEPAGFLFAAAGKDLKAVQDELDTANPHVAGFDIEGVTITIDAKVDREKRTGHNVLAMLPGTGTDTGTYVMVGAHFDHLGRGTGGNSLARKEEQGQVHFGADDNASGVAAVLEAGRQVAVMGLPKPVILAFWSGEEMGLLGSAAFVEDAPVPMESIIGYINLDMVGRMKDNTLSVLGLGSSPEWASLIEGANVPVGFSITKSDDPYTPTDSSSFYLAGVPILALFTGAHEDYHRPADTADKLNYEDLGRVSRFTALLARRVAMQGERLEYAKVEQEVQPASSRGRVFTGTIPDYTQEVEGLKLSGVIEGGPADKAGLEGGDVIVEFNGKAIKNIYDYMYVLNEVKIGEPTSLVVLRGEERLELEMVPAARE